jgi:hypothetical protein
MEISCVGEKASLVKINEPYNYYLIEHSLSLSKMQLRHANSFVKG